MDIGQRITDFFASIEAYNTDPTTAHARTVCANLKALQAVYPSPQWDTQLPDGVSCSGQ